MASFRLGMALALATLCAAISAQAQPLKSYAPRPFTLVSSLSLVGSFEPNVPLTSRLAPSRAKKDGPRESRFDLRGAPSRRYQLSLYVDDTSQDRRTRIRFALPGLPEARPVLFVASGFDGVNVRHAEPARGMQTRGLDVLRRHDERLFRWLPANAGRAGFGLELAGTTADAAASVSAAAVLGRLLQLIAR